MKQLWQDWLAKRKKPIQTVLFPLLLVGVMLLLFGKSFATEETEQSTASEGKQTVQSDQEKQMEVRLEAILSQIEGAGNVRVMITFQNSGEKLLATEEKTQMSYLSASEQKQEESTETSVVLAEGVTGKEEPLLLREDAPAVEGVVIVAEGAADSTVQAALTEAAQALLDVPIHKIAVLQMEKGGS